MSAASLEQITPVGSGPDPGLGNLRGGAYDGILSDPNWKTLRAVANRRVYAVPDNPFAGSTAPGGEPALGVRWAAALIYPEVFRYDLVKEAQRFYRLFWRYDLTAEEARDILRHSVRKE
jgi:iron complex transport system substrate-binding protein